MSITAIKPQTDLSHIGLENLAANKNVSEKDKIGEVARQFESYLLRQYLAEAKKSQITSTANPESSTSRIYQDMVTQQLAENISKAGTFGLGNALKEQLIRQNAGPSAINAGARLEKAQS